MSGDRKARGVSKAAYFCSLEDIEEAVLTPPLTPTSSWRSSTRFRPGWSRSRRWPRRGSILVRPARPAGVDAVPGATPVVHAVEVMLEAGVAAVDGDSHGLPRHCLHEGRGRFWASTRRSGALAQRAWVHRSGQTSWRCSRGTTLPRRDATVPDHP